MLSACHVSSHIGNCAWINIQYNSWMGLYEITLSQCWKKKTHLWRHITAVQAALIFLASRWEFGIIEFWEARRTSYPAHFTALSQTGVISPISWMNASAPDARALPHICEDEARLRYPEGYSSESWILAIVLWGDALSVVYTFPPGGSKQVSGEVSQISCRVQ